MRCMRFAWDGKAIQRSTGLPCWCHRPLGPDIPLQSLHPGALPSDLIWPHLTSSPHPGHPHLIQGNHVNALSLSAVDAVGIRWHQLSLQWRSLVVHCPTLSYHVLPCPTMSYRVLPCPTMLNRRAGHHWEPIGNLCQTCDVEGNSAPSPP